MRGNVIPKTLPRGGEVINPPI